MVGSDWGLLNMGGFVCQDEGSGSAAQFWLRDNTESLPQMYGLFPSSSYYVVCVRVSLNALASAVRGVSKEQIT